ncbi:MAG: transglycosylase domain-containing protein [Lachnospiraceae bacterium]|nr:transglycosylase domain-containing protein [Lachnospiraceae bacterium]
MNYGRRSIRKKQRRLNAKSVKFSKMFLLALEVAVLVGLLSVGIVGVCVGIGAFKGILASAPDISALDVTPTGYATIVYNAKGKQIAKLVGTSSNRSYIGKDQIPQDLKDAFVAIEDERFYEHNGIDIYGIIRAGVSAVKSRHLGQGASTITQQLLKNNVFEGWTEESSDLVKIRRKIQEQYLALELEKRMSKEDILELYMNSINLGQNTLGVQTASMRYFNKPVTQLSLSECAVIAGITQNPSKYNPISHPDKNAEKRETVLKYMLQQGYIEQYEFDAAMADDVYSRIKVVNEAKDTNAVNSYFVDALIEQVIDALMEEKGYNETQAYNLVYSSGLQIFATQDPQIQTICDDIYNNEENYPANTQWLLDYQLTVKTKDEEYLNYSTEAFKQFMLQQNPKYNLLYSSQDAAYDDIAAYQESLLQPGDEVYAEKVNMTPQPQVSLTIEDQHTGYVVAMIGGRGTKSASRTLNRAVGTMRQPGSTFKVVAAYAAALDAAGLTLASVQNDAPYEYANGTPVRNWYGESYKGICSLRYGIEQSLNIVAVKTLTQITPQLGFDYLRNLGFTTLVERKEVNTADGTKILSDVNQALALGGITYGVKNIELNAAYAAIANGGKYYKPTLFTKILDHDGNVMIDRTVPESRQVLKKSTAFLLTDAMTDVVTKGTGTSVNFSDEIAIAGKTGTTSDYKDVWFAGYTPYYTATCWTGYDNNIKMTDTAEKNFSKTMWRAVMEKIHENKPAKGFDVPDDIVTASVCSKSGKLPIQGVCSGCTVTEYFASGSVPTETCDIHFSGMVCAATGMAACSTCPYQTQGVIQLTPGDDGLPVTHYCPHTAEYLANPEHAAEMAQAAAEMAQRQQAEAIAAQQAAQQAAAQAALEAQQAAIAQQQAAQQAQQAIDNQ